MSSPKISVVVLSYNRPALLRQALEALALQTYPASLLEVLVVDNRSAASGEVASIVARFPAMRLIANEQNLGFTGGMNAGIQQATGELVYITEDDIVLSPENVAELARYLLAHPEAGMVAGVMQTVEDRRIWCAGGEVTLTPRFSLTVHGQGERDKGQYKAPFPVTYIPGATMMARAEVWAELKGFREDFFMYLEDVELCLRLQRAGLGLVIVPAARSYHFTPPPGPGSPFIAFHKSKNLAALYLLHAPARALPEIMLRLVAHDLRSAVRHPSTAFTTLRALRHTAASVAGLLRDRRRIFAQPVHAGG